MSASRTLTIVVTGASRGLGSGMARTFLERGHNLGLCSRSPPPPDLRNDDDGSGDDNKKLYYQSGVDVGDPSAVESFLNNVVDRFDRPIDLWINNAGVLEPVAPILDTDPDDFERNVRTNLAGVFHGTRAFVLHRAESFGDDDGDATLVNISSRGATDGHAGCAAYCASKAGVDRLTECVALEERERRRHAASSSYFRAYSIVPGAIDTDMQRTLRNAPRAVFPEADTFARFRTEGTFNHPRYVAERVEELALLVGAQTSPVVRRLKPERTWASEHRTNNDHDHDQDHDVRVGQS